MNTANSLSVKTRSPADLYAGSVQTLFESGKGCRVEDTCGRSYLDFASGLWNVLAGHGCDAVVSAMSRQAGKLAYHATFAGQDNRPSQRLLQRLSELLQPEAARKVYFCGADTEVNETAFRLVRHYWKLHGDARKTHIVSLSGGHHGYHFASIAASDNSQAKAMAEPALPGFTSVRGPAQRDLAWAPSAMTGAILADLEKEIAGLGAERVAAFVAEPVQGPGGVVLPPDGLWAGLREICDKRRILLIADEVVTGFGRTGKLLAGRHWGARPDIITLGKGLTSGYAGLGAIVACGNVGEDLEKASLAESGFFEVAQPLPAAVALANIDVLLHLMGSVNEIGAWLQLRLEELATTGGVRNVRGIGLMCAFEPVGMSPAKCCELLRREGLVVRPSATHVLLAPPLVVSRAECGEALDAIAAVCRGKDQA